MLTLNTTRQPFDGIAQPKRIDLKSYKIRGQARCPPIINLLIIGSSIGLFIYVNSYFIQRMLNVINGSIFSTTTQTFSCDFYYCDQTAYNFINYYSNYVKCNTQNCQNIVCSSYDCNNSTFYNLNYYYACQGKCGPLQKQAVPPIFMGSYIVALLGVGFFGLGIVIGIVYGLIAGLCGKDLTFSERLGLMLTWLWPKLKYYAFRRRQEWDHFYFDLRGMVIVDMIINLFYAVTLGLYIYMETNQFWQTGPEIACFYLLIWATVSRATMVGEVAGPFFEATRELSVMRLEIYS